MRRAAIALVVASLGIACGPGGDSREGASDSPENAENEASVSSSEPVVLCESDAAEVRALAPEGAQPLNTPGLADTYTSSLCIVHYGIDAPVQQIRDFYEASLAEQGFELSRNEIMEGAMPGNESRTFILGAKSDRSIFLTIDEFSRKTEARPFSVTIQLQLESSER